MNSPGTQSTYWYSMQAPVRVGIIAPLFACSTIGASASTAAVTTCAARNSIARP